jgi:hypothetical protein
MRRGRFITSLPEVLSERQFLERGNVAQNIQCFGVGGDGVRYNL